MKRSLSTRRVDSQPFLPAVSQLFTDTKVCHQPKYTARPKREGYFICAGEVEVAARRGRVKGSKNKPKVRVPCSFSQQVSILTYGTQCERQMDENGNPIPQAARRRSGKVVLGPDGKPRTWPQSLLISLKNRRQSADIAFLPLLVADVPDGASSGAASPAVTGGPTFGAPAGPPPPKQRKKASSALFLRLDVP